MKRNSVSLRTRIFLQLYPKPLREQFGLELQEALLQSARAFGFCSQSWDLLQNWVTHSRYSERDSRLLLADGVIVGSLTQLDQGRISLGILSLATFLSTLLLSFIHPVV